MTELAASSISLSVRTCCSESSCGGERRVFEVQLAPPGGATCFLTASAELRIASSAFGRDNILRSERNRRAADNCR